MERAGTHSREVILTAAAEVDFRNVILWTAEHFGEARARAYSETLSAAIEVLIEGPTTPGARLRDDIAKGVHALHIARNGRKGRHFVLFRVARGGGRRIEVLRLLHDAMDFPRHLPRKGK